jgi:hypothetical protein
MKTNLKDYALKVLETAKENLRRDRYLLPAAFIVTDNDVSDFNLQFEDAHQKRSVYAELVELAGQKATRAIITINDTTVTSDLEADSLGIGVTRADREAKQDCIFLTISGPSIPTWPLSMPYTSIGDEIVFGKPTETVNDASICFQGGPPQENQMPRTAIRRRTYSALVFVYSLQNR